jgi:hybrid cluster-associated redox disulfide protein
MKYFRSSQPVPGQGFAWTFYECEDDRTIIRYVTFVPETLRTDRISKPVVKKLFDSNTLMETTEDEFKRYWPDGAEDSDAAAQTEAKSASAPAAKGSGGAMRYFSLDMTIGEAMQLHPRVPEVFAAFHLGGCSHCGINEIETIGQVCMGYGVDADTLLEVLEGLMDGEEKPEEAGQPSS